MATLNAHALTTTQRLATFAGLGTITPGSTKEEQLIYAINSTTDYIEKYCGRRFKLTTYTGEEYDGRGGSVLLLNNYPIVTGSLTLEVRNSALNESDWSYVDSEYYFVDLSAGMVRAANDGIRFTPGTNNFRATYQAGYDFDNSTTFLSDAGAADLEFLAWKLGASVFNERGGGLGIQSERIGDLSVVYAKSAFESEELRSILDKYSRDEVASPITPLNT